MASLGKSSILLDRCFEVLIGSKQTGFADTVPVIREATVKAIISLSDKVLCTCSGVLFSTPSPTNSVQ